MAHLGTRLPKLTLWAALLLALAGCSNLPTAPGIQAGSSTTASGGAPAQTLSVNLLDGSTTSSATKTAVVGVLGGVISAGGFTVVIPAGALTQTATVTVSQPDLAHPVVDLSISPPSANGFLQPVLLVADAKPLSPSLLSTACISYYNPATGRWETVAGSTASLVDLTVSAPLWHFSTYRVSSGGKAGW